MNKVTALKDVDIRYGGKALGLKKLIEAGLNVPSGMALTPKELLSIVNENSLDYLMDISNFFKSDDLLAVRSSALNEDGSGQSFAGLYSSELNITNNPQKILTALKKVFESSLSTEIQKYSGNDVDKMGVVVQKMINPKYAGVMFTEATDLKGENCCLIELVKGLGEQLVSGHSHTTRIIIPYDKQNKLILSKARVEGKIDAKEIINILFDSINKINKYFKKGMDIEWCVDNNNIAHIVQARPITKHILIQEITNNSGTIASIGKCKGKTFVIDSDLDDSELLKEISNFKSGYILIAPFTDTQYMPAINKAIGIITEEGSILSHAAIISREKGIPCIVGFANASQYFPSESEIIMDTANGLVQSKSYSSKCDTRDLDWESLYVFDNVQEKKSIKKTQIVIEKSPFCNMDFVVHVDDDITADQYNNIEYYFRKIYHCPAKFVSSEKFLWFDEYNRFNKFNGFRKSLKSAKKICSSLDCAALSKFYENTITQASLMVDKKHATSSKFEKFELEEKMASLHFISDLIIPAGYGLLSVYNCAKSIDKELNFNDFLKGKFHKEIPSLNKAYDFMNLLEQIRNSICQKFVDMGAYSFNYFDDRENRAKSALKSLGLKYTQSPVDNFYKIIEEQELLKKNNKQKIKSTKFKTSNNID